MNLNILNPEVQEFISQNLKIDITKIILKGSPFSFVNIKEIADQIISKKKCEKKLPNWFFSKNIYYPNKISIEQTSSEVAAEYKAKLISGKSIIDITGGFGVDCFYFSKKFEKVYHCEINEELSEIVNHNYNQLGVNNIKTISGNGFDYLKSNDSIFDIIYIDPSRRNSIKEKVFLLKDCMPYIPPKIDFFFSKSNSILIKLSPILDLTNTIKELKNIKSIFIVAIKNEVKELLFLLEKDYDKKIKITSTNINKESIDEFSFNYGEKNEATFSLPEKYLYEPNAAILKSGGFNNISCKLKVNKLHKNSHLYTSKTKINFPGRVFKIIEDLPYDKKKIKKQFSKTKANITTRNFPKTVNQIRKENNIKDGGNRYIFFTKDKENSLRVLLCEKC